MLFKEIMFKSDNKLFLFTPLKLSINLGNL